MYYLYSIYNMLDSVDALVWHPYLYLKDEDTLFTTKKLLAYPFYHIPSNEKWRCFQDTINRLLDYQIWVTEYNLFDKTYDFHENPHKGNHGLKRAFYAFKNSWSGLIFAFREESAFRQELLLLFFSLFMVVVLETSIFEKFLMLFSSIFILIIELLNSSVEAAIDRISFDYHGLSKRAKDYGSAAVLLSILIWIIIHLYVLVS